MERRTFIKNVIGVAGLGVLSKSIASEHTSEIIKNFDSNTSNITFHSNGNERLRISSDGGLWIATSSPEKRWGNE